MDKLLLTVEEAAEVLRIGKPCSLRSDPGTAAWKRSRSVPVDWCPRLSLPQLIALLLEEERAA